MTIHRALLFSIPMSAISFAGPALAQNCTRQGVDVACDDGRRGMLSGDSIIFADGIIGNKSSVVVGQGVFAGEDKTRSGRAARFSMARRIAISSTG